VASGNFFSLLGVQARLGRVFTPKDDRQGFPKPGRRDQRRLLAAPLCARPCDRRADRISGRLAGQPLSASLRRAFLGMRTGTGTDIFLPIELQPQVDERKDKLHDAVGHGST